MSPDVISRHRSLRRDCSGAALAIYDRPLDEADWTLVRTFVRSTAREDLRLRFGRPIAFDDESTLRRFFDVTPGDGEMCWLFDRSAAIAGILHRVMVSPAEAEIGLIVRSDVQRTGIGECLLLQTLQRSARLGIKTLSALVLRDNRAALRLAAKLGFASRGVCALTVELARDLA